MNNTIYTIIGAGTAGIAGEVIKEGTFSQNQYIDIAIKIFVPIITGVIVALIQRKNDRSKNENK